MSSGVADSASSLQCYQTRSSWVQELQTVLAACSVTRLVRHEFRSCRHCLVTDWMWWDGNGAECDRLSVCNSSVVKASGCCLGSLRSILFSGRKEIFYLTTHSTHFIYGYMASDIWYRTTQIAREETRCRHMGWSYLVEGRKEGNVLFNDTLNTFYLRLYGIRHMVTDQSDSERGNPPQPHDLILFSESLDCLKYFQHLYDC